MSTYALIHGAWGSGWHWASIPERLTALGHDVVAVDLPCDDPAKSYDDYADVVVEALEGAGDDVVVAAFSLGGLTAPLVAARRPARRLVYVAGVVPEPGVSVVDRLRSGGTLFHPEFHAGVAADEQGRVVWTDVGVYHRVGYGDAVDRATVQERFDRLRPQSFAPDRLPCSLDAHPDVPTTYVLCTADRLLDNAYWEPYVREQLGIEPVRLDSSHTAVVTLPEEVVAILAG